MSTFFTIIGATVVFLLSVAALIGAIAAFHWAIEERRRHFRNEAYDEAIIRIGNRIEMFAHWYSENEDAEDLAKAIGQYMARTGAYDEDGVRRKWREAMERRKSAAAPAGRSET